jgi:nucleotidyltransferase/DNA polymerase involved in DNA repair
VILCCRIPDIPIAALVLAQGERGERGQRLDGRPLVVGGHPSERKPVRAASVEARAFGVCVGMPLRQAEQLCPEALFFPADPAAESSLARHLLAGLYALAPRVELAAGGEAYIEVDGLGEPAFFTARVGAYLHQRLRSRPALGLGSNKFVAWVAAGLASAGAVVDGELPPRLVKPGSERSFLASLAIGDCLPGMPDLCHRLRLFGLRRLGDLAAMPLAAVQAQFGREGLEALKLARGEDSRRLQPWEPPQRIEEQSRLDPAVDNITPLLFVARGLVDRMGERLMEGGYAVTTVRLRLEMDDPHEAPIEAQLKLRSPMSTGEELWTPVSQLLQRQAMTAPVGRIGLRVSGFCPAQSRQVDLLTRADARLEDITRQLHMIADAYGAELIQMPRLAPVAPVIDERRHHWTDAAESLGAQATARGRRRRIA